MLSRVRASRAIASQSHRPSALLPRRGGHRHGQPASRAAAAAARESFPGNPGEEPRPPLPPFTQATAVQKVRLAEDGWNSRDAEKVAKAYTEDTRWRNRTTFVRGRDQAQAFLADKWQHELEYRLIKELWAVDGDRLAVRYAYEYKTEAGAWFRAYGNENWHFAANGLMAVRHSSINDLAITEEERLFLWPLGRRPDDHASLSDLGL